MARIARRTGSVMAYPTEKKVRIPRFRMSRTWARKAFADPALSVRTRMSVPCRWASGICASAWSKHRDVVGGGVGAGVAGPQPPVQRLAGVGQETQQRVSAAVLLPAFPGRSSPATGSPDPPWPWSTNPISGWWPKVFFQVAAASCFSECASTSTPSRSTVTWPPASGAASPASCQTCSRTSARAVRIAARAFAAGGQGVDQAGDRRVGGHRPEHGRLGPQHARHRPGSPRPARPPAPHPAGSCPDRAPPAACATAPAPPISPGPGRSCGPSRPAARPRPGRPPRGRRPRHGHAGRTRYASSPGEVLLSSQPTGPSASPIVAGQEHFPLF